MSNFGQVAAQLERHAGTARGPMHRYQSYGLLFLSDIELPELSPAGPDALPEDGSVRIHRRAIELPAGVRDLPTWTAFGPEGVRFWWQTVGAFEVCDGGRTILVDPAPDVSDDLIAFPLLGPVLSECLRRCGYFVLHASAVDLDGQGIVLMADKGTGKSSSSAALLRAGARLLADDLVAIDPATGLIWPGFGQVKLAQENLSHQLPGQDWQARPQVHEQIDKVRVMVPELLARAPIPAARLCLLSRGRGEIPELSPLALQDRISAVLDFSYAVRFGKDGMTGDLAARHFQGAVMLARSVPLRRLELPCGIDRLDTLAPALRRDLDTQSEDRSE
ncbi:hypothetical protein SAMN05216224_101316 [Thioclava dalianensis]|nr:hypothetical protein SAMN05216224_101316 [Thioclava dalianensis]